MSRCLLVAAIVGLSLGLAVPVVGQDVCEGFGPQAPRDISNVAGTNPLAFSPAPEAASLNLCNIHVHRHAEHKGPGFLLADSEDGDGGYRCNDSAFRTSAELFDPTPGHGAFRGVAPGDTMSLPLSPCRDASPHSQAPGRRRMEVDSPSRASRAGTEAGGRCCLRTGRAS